VILLKPRKNKDMLNSSLTKAFSALKSGKIIVYPTDTLYAFGVDIFNNKAVRNVFELKKRPENQPLPVAVCNLSQMDSIAQITELATLLAENFLPGPLTLILKKKSNISSVISGGLDKVAIRIPDNEIALTLICNYGPLTVTSANVHNEPIFGNIEEIKKRFFTDEVSVYIDGGTLGGDPSTIVDATGYDPIIIRQGRIKKSEILELSKK
jgi:L-threonylcarbamoyladenylate synthase